MMVPTLLFRASLVLAALILVSCSNALESLPEGQQAQVIASSDKTTRAFVWIPKQSGGLGATVSQPYQVWIENEKFGQKRLMLEASKTDGLRLVWISDSILEVCYSDAQIFRFLNKFDFVVQGSHEMKSVEIILRKAASLDAC